MLSTLGAPERRRCRTARAAGRRAQPEPVPTNRATVVQADRSRAMRRLGAGSPSCARTRSASRPSSSRRPRDRPRPARPPRGPGRPSRARRVPPGARGPDRLRRRGGRGRRPLRGGLGAAPRARRTRRSMEAPEERFAALLGAREAVLVCEELVLRARADLDAGRRREAALQARVALESPACRAGGRAARGRGGRRSRPTARRWGRRQRLPAR